MTLEKLERLMNWFSLHGGFINPDVEIRQQEHGIGLYLQHGKTLRPGTRIISCPHKLTISALDLIGAGSWPEGVLIAWKDSPEVLTRFFLMEQWLQREHSFWWPYLSILPQPGTEEVPKTPLFYTALEDLCIRGTNLENSKDARVKAWEADFTRGISILEQSDNQRFGASYTLLVPSHSQSELMVQ